MVIRTEYGPKMASMRLESRRCSRLGAGRRTGVDSRCASSANAGAWGEVSTGQSAGAGATACHSDAGGESTTGAGSGFVAALVHSAAGASVACASTGSGSGVWTCGAVNSTTPLTVGGMPGANDAKLDAG